jgi:hypothetical protein
VRDKCVATETYTRWTLTCRRGKRRIKSERSQLSLTLSATSLALPKSSAEKPVSSVPASAIATTPPPTEPTPEHSGTPDPAASPIHPPEPSTSASAPALATVQSPVPTPPGDETSVSTGQKRKRFITVQDDSGKKRKIVDVHSFHPDLQNAVLDIQEAAKDEDWSEQGRFPTALKPKLADLAMLAIHLDEYDDHFFRLMPTLFPYNTFTMTVSIFLILRSDWRAWVLVT